MGYRDDVLQSWMHSAPSVRGLAGTLDVPTPISLRDTLIRLAEVETFTLESDINTNDDTPINGHVGLQVWSDGRYRFFGHVRATGFPSYDYGLQASVVGANGASVAAVRSGSVYGTDTPGDRQDNWDESGVEPGIAMRWADLRAGQSRLAYTFNAEIGGLLGTAADVLEFVGAGIIASTGLGAVGWAVLVGVELTGIASKVIGPSGLAGLVTAGGVLWLLGPYGLIPAFIAGAIVAAVTDISYRAISDDERAFADRIFNGTIDYDRVTLTNLSHGGGRAYTIPVGTAILVNLNTDLDDPMGSAHPGTDYGQPGAVFIHELTHAWQITNNSFLGVLCGMSSNYDYHLKDGETHRTDPDDLGWTQKAWGEFNNEQQAHIVDDFYGAHVVPGAGPNGYALDGGIPVTDLNGPAALNDPAYPFIRDHIRTGST